MGWIDGRAFVVALVVSCAGGIGAFHALSGESGSGSPDEGQADVVLASGADRYPNSTASDWVTYADHVVVASVVDERRKEPTDLEIQRGEGLILRELTISVDRVVWSAAGAGPAPSVFSWPALGWTFEAEPAYRETIMAGEHTPRLEVGNTYLFALDSPSRYCDVSLNEPTWRALGASAVVPLDEGTIGAGEFEGRTVSPAEARSDWKQIGASLAASVSGRGVPDLESALEKADSNLVARRSARADKCD